MSEKSPRWRKAVFTYEDSPAGPLYYFAPAERPASPYRVQRRVEAIIDIADDGTLAGVELIDNMPPLDATGVPPLPVPEQDKEHDAGA